MIITKKNVRKQITDLSMDLEIINPIESKTILAGGWYDNGYGITITYGGGGSSGGDYSYDSSGGSYSSDWNNIDGSNGNGGGGSAGNYQETTQWDNSSFFSHYNNGNGEAVNLSNIGLRDDVISSEVYLNMMASVNNQIEAFVHQQVAQGSNHPGIYQFTWDFNNSYDFTLESNLFAIGAATVGGEFSGSFTVDSTGHINVNGVINLNFHDRFEDPWDIVNFTDGTWDPTGTPYDINDNWQQSILMQDIKP